MGASDILPYITGTGGALIVLLAGCWLFVSGKIYPAKVLEDKDRQIADLRQAIANERLRAETAVLAAQTTNAVLTALHQEVARGDHQATAQISG